jgi:hypothetical membrane protein
MPERLPLSIMSTKNTFSTISAICGIAGCLVMLACVWAASFPYTGMYDETYSPINHYISELGDRRYSEWAALFNVGLMLSSSLLLVFSIGFARQFGGWQRAVIGILGLSTSISCFLVGAFPVDNLRPHILVAMVFFHSALVLVFLNTAITIFTKKPVLPKWSVSLGFVTALAFAAFVISPSDLLREWVKDPKHFVRPDVWVQPILEWACFYSIILWLLTAAFLMLRNKPAPTLIA